MVSKQPVELINGGFRGLIDRFTLGKWHVGRRLVWCEDLMSIGKLLKGLTFSRIGHEVALFESV